MVIQSAYFRHALRMAAIGRIATLLPRPRALALIKLLSVPPFLTRRPLRSQDNEPCFLILCALTGAERLKDFFRSPIGPGCVKTPPPPDGRSRLQMQRDMPLTSLGGDNALSVGALASSENLTGLKTIAGVHFYVFTQPRPKADAQSPTRSDTVCKIGWRLFQLISSSHQSETGPKQVLSRSSQMQSLASVGFPGR
jgi:hypothetical protein